MTNPALYSIPVAFALQAFALCAEAAEHARRWEIDGPVAASLVRVIDGDTLLVSANPWPQQTVEVYVRLRGIDAPELRSRCESVERAGARARSALSGMLKGEHRLMLERISADKYFGRVVADIRLSNGRNPAQELVAAGLVRPYDGGRKASASCPSVS